jgi:hypothetical protein
MTVRTRTDPSLGLTHSPQFAPPASLTELQKSLLKGQTFRILRVRIFD